MYIYYIESSNALCWKRRLNVIQSNPPGKSRDVFNYIRWLRTLSNFSWNVSSLFQCFTALIVKYVFLISNLNLPPFSLKSSTITPFSVATCRAKDCPNLSYGLSSSIENPSLLQPEQPEHTEVSHSLHLWRCSGPSPTAPWLSCAEDSSAGLQMRSHQREKITSFNLPTMLLSIPIWIWLAFWTASTHCQVVFSFSCINTPTSFSAGLL